MWVKIEATPDRRIKVEASEQFNLDDVKDLAVLLDLLAAGISAIAREKLYDRQVIKVVSGVANANLRV